MAIVLGAMFVVLTIAIAGQAGTGIARTDAGVGRSTSSARSSSSRTIIAELRPGLGAVRLGLHALPARSRRDGLAGLLVDGPRADRWRAGWLEVLGLLVADKATEGGAVDTINTILSGTPLAALAMLAIGIGTVAVNAMNDYTGSLSLQAAGIRVPRIVSALIVAVLGFLVTLWLNSGDLVGKIENILLFLSYWIAPWAAVVLADWRMRGGRADVSRLVNYSGLPSGLLGLAAAIIGFVVSLPFQTSTLGGEIATNTGLPINTIAANYLHYADLAYLVGFVVAFAVFLVGSRAAAPKETPEEPAEQPAA